MAERTGCPVLSSLWSYVLKFCLNVIIFDETVGPVWKPKTFGDSTSAREVLIQISQYTKHDFHAVV
jgi:hypothetical protein